MNQVTIIGRLTKDPEVRYTEKQTCVARFSVALNRGKDKDGKDLGADYPNVVAFGKTGEIIEKYFSKGKLIGISGRIRTDSYEKDGKKYYTTDIIADKVEFLEKKENPEQKVKKETPEDIPEGFSRLEDDDIPF